jgi:hypothetical protein
VLSFGSVGVCVELQFVGMEQNLSLGPDLRTPPPILKAVNTPFTLPIRHWPTSHPHDRPGDYTCS